MEEEEPRLLHLEGVIDPGTGEQIGPMDAEDEDVQLFARFARLPRAPWDWLFATFTGNPYRYNFRDRFDELHCECEEMVYHHGEAFSGFRIMAEREVSDEFSITHILSFIFPENRQPYSIAMSNGFGPFECKFFPIIASMGVSARLIPNQLAIITDWMFDFTSFAPKIIGFQNTGISLAVQTMSTSNPNAPFFGGGEIEIEMPTSIMGMQYNVHDSSFGINFSQCLGDRLMAGTSFETSQGIATLSQGFRGYWKGLLYSGICQWHTMTGFFSASFGVTQILHMGATVNSTFYVNPQQNQETGGIYYEPKCNIGLIWPSVAGETTVSLNSDGLLTSELEEDFAFPISVSLIHQLNVKTMSDHQLGLKFEVTL